MIELIDMGSHRKFPQQSEFAHAMRFAPTDAERALWHRLRHDIVVSGSHFRRQALIGKFIVDFVSRKAKLVIELDGGQHDENRAADDSRTSLIESEGYRVLRFWNHDVLRNIDGVLEEIRSALTPTPDPSPQGGGENDLRGKPPSASLTYLPSTGDPFPQGEGE